ncbi:hypothetical protein CEXT_550721 [Caerostris extrusa]|uniref:Transposase n=1 Tax=Caerostris extrusa TaxID=172846 RepID=A0AAV4XNG8_CAEEX|nr:hypothetical protein CEXT_550721 [Caerostris extrusa]
MYFVSNLLAEFVSDSKNEVFLFLFFRSKNSRNFPNLQAIFPENCPAHLSIRVFRRLVGEINSPRSRGQRACCAGKTEYRGKKTTDSEYKSSRDHSRPGESEDIVMDVVNDQIGLVNGACLMPDRSLNG